MSRFRISSQENPAGADCAVVNEGLGAFNNQSAPLHEVQPLASFARDEDGRLVGGALGRRWGRCAEIQQLWVEESARGQGLGSQLVGAFEAAAQAQGCTSFYLETLSFQAPGFYAKLGYRSAHVLDLYPHGIVKHLMIKTI